jgi:hypothetical protein
MVITTIHNTIRDLPHVYFIQRDKGPILIGMSHAPASTIISLQYYHPENLFLLSHRPAAVGEVATIKAHLRAHHIRNGWHAPSPEVLDAAAGRVPTGPAPRTGGRKLSEADTLEVFRMAHGMSLNHAVIGARFGVSAITVGRIGRGLTRPHLFRREAAPALPGVPGSAEDFYISEAREGAVKYRMREGKRGAK